MRSFGPPTDADADADVTDDDIDEQTVIQVAAAWSLNPLHLDTTPTSAGTGITGHRR